VKGAHFKRRSEKRLFIWHNIVAGVATVTGGLLGFALQSFSSHAMHPADYGKAFAVATLFGLLTKPAAAFSRLVTWNTSRERAIKGRVGHDSGLLLRDMTWQLFALGSVMALLSIAGGSVLAGYLHVSFTFIVVGAITIPFTLAGPSLIGELQGEERFVPWALIGILVAGSRLLFVALFVFMSGALGYLIGITVASVFAFVVTLIIVLPGMRGIPGRFKWRPVIPFVIVAVTSSITISVYLGVDVIMVEHFFPKVQGGIYSIAAVLGRSVFFALGGVASVQFPKVSGRVAKGRSTAGVVGASLGLCAAVGIVGTLFLQFIGRYVLLGFAGRAYLAGAGLLGWYGFGMMVLGGAVILVNTQQSLNDPALLWVLAPMSFLEPLLILLFHRTLLDVVLAADASIVLFFIVLAFVYARGELARHRDRDATTDRGLDGDLPSSRTRAGVTAGVPAL